MDPDTLRQNVEDAVNVKLSAREHFTTVDISKPLIHVDNGIRHREVRQIIDNMWAQGDIENAAFAVGSVTVYPKHRKGNGMQVRLFHPDEPTYDPASYTATHQEVVRDEAVATRGFDMDTEGDDGTSGSDSVSVVTNTPSGASVTKQCQIQAREGTLNIPVTLVRSAGFRAKDEIAITISGATIQVKKSTPGSQQVDGENRIRLHGKNVSCLGKSVGVPCLAMVVQPDSGDTYIQIT